MFTLNSEISIGDFVFSGVHEVVIKRSVHSCVETATVKIPAMAAIRKGNRVLPQLVSTGNQFKEGDPVVIKLGYNGLLKTEFTGFVKEFAHKRPLEIECEGYSYLLRRNKAERKEKNTLRELLTDAVRTGSQDYEINLTTTLDFALVNMPLANSSGFDVVTKISKSTDSNVSFFFLDFDHLWCGCLYTNVKADATSLKSPTVDFRIGYNALNETTLKSHDTSAKPGLVEYRIKRSGGGFIAGRAGQDKDGVVTPVMLNHLNNATILKELAQEKVWQNTYTGYEGKFTAFLEPYAAPGYRVNIKNGVYPENDGKYLVESTEVTFGVKGARRVIELGPRIGSI